MRNTRARPAEEGWCLDCRWLETRIGFSGPSNYWCAVREESLGGAIAWRRACKEFRRQAWA